MKAAKICKFSTLKYFFFLNLFNCSLAYDFPLCICVFVVAPGHAPNLCAFSCKQVYGPAFFSQFFCESCLVAFCGNRLDKLQVVTRRCCRVNVLRPFTARSLSHTHTHTDTIPLCRMCVVVAFINCNASTNIFLAFLFYHWPNENKKKLFLLQLTTAKMEIGRSEWVKNMDNACGYALNCCQFFVPRRCRLRPLLN